MSETAPRTIHIASALIDDGDRRLLLVRKAGSARFMLAGGKIEGSERPIDALRREVFEEIGLTLAEDDVRHLGHFSAPAANEPGHIVHADVFHVRTRHYPVAGAEIEEAIWVDRDAALTLPLATLAREHVIPLAHTL